MSRESLTKMENAFNAKMDFDQSDHMSGTNARKDMDYCGILDETLKINEQQIFGVMQTQSSIVEEETVL
jgi:hypothetical protein